MAERMASGDDSEPEGNPFSAAFTDPETPDSERRFPNVQGEGVDEERGGGEEDISLLRRMALASMNGDEGLW